MGKPSEMCEFNPKPSQAVRHTDVISKIGRNLALNIEFWLYKKN
jgi:hypothetical protein